MADRSWLRAGDDEVRAHLDQELSRTRDTKPHSALGLTVGADRAVVRTAFLEATKSYHPARFARRPGDIKKLANQVFMLKKEAYDQLIDKAPESQPKPEPSPPPVRRPASRRPRRAGRAVRAPARSGSKPKPTKPAAEPSVAKAAASPEPVKAAPPEPTIDVHQIPEFRTASTHCDRGEYTQAKALLRELKAKHPDNSVIVSHFHYAASGEHLGRGRMRHAAAELKLAVAADPDFEAAKKALAKLAASRLRRS